MPPNPSDDTVTQHLGSMSGVAVASFDLHVLSGAGLGTSWRLASGATRVGSAPSCDVQLPDPTVSRLHCEIQIEPQGARIIDLDSTNGVLLDGVRVYDAELRAGSTLVLGSTALRIELATEPVPVALSLATRFGPLLGASFAMRRVYGVLERCATTDATVLVQGETGTGKEAVARALHDASARSAGAFVTVDCGALPENLIESELFGHVRGAFSGAISDRSGLFEEAHGGTLFLDEIGELPVSLQPKLLRALESREVRRVGSNAPRRVDVRIVAATNRPLARAINAGTFREDLYYRLAVIEVQLPALRARREDIPMLAQHFFEELSGTKDRLPAGFVAGLLGRAWPGNVRELRNFMERSVALGGVGNRTPGLAGEQAPTPPGLEAFIPFDLPLKEAREVWNAYLEQLYTTGLLRRATGSVTRAAELAGVHRRSLHRLMAEYGIRGRAEAEPTSGVGVEPPPPPSKRSR
ncbi:MAG: sigma 54-interacting transcriptional regulator [Myxococcales bacterium]|nr:sigma 54-interacting transcriptional regulator [Myxococcales bacterium]